MPQTCSICSHAKRHEIEKAIAQGGKENSYRNLAIRYTCSVGSIQRHIKNCVSTAIRQVKSAKEELLDTKQAASVEAIREGVAEQVRNGTLATAVTVEAVVNRLFEVLLLMLDAVDRDLRDPNDPLAYNLSPRAMEVRIVWDELEEQAEEGAKKKWIRKSGTLQEALDLAFANSDRRLVRDQGITHLDRGKLLFEAVAKLKEQNEFLAKLEGRFLPVEKELGQGNTIQLSVVQHILILNGLLKG